jgi:hypothetical protein
MARSVKKKPRTCQLCDEGMPTTFYIAPLSSYACIICVKRYLREVFEVGDDPDE